MQPCATDVDHLGRPAYLSASRCAKQSIDYHHQVSSVGCTPQPRHCHRVGMPTVAVGRPVVVTALNNASSASCWATEINKCNMQNCAQIWQVSTQKSARPCCGAFGGAAQACHAVMNAVQTNYKLLRCLPHQNCSAQTSVDQRRLGRLVPPANSTAPTTALLSDTISNTTHHHAAACARLVSLNQTK